MKQEYKVIRLHALDEIAEAAKNMRTLQRPPLGWLRTVREGLGLSLRKVATMVGVSAPTLHEFERNEATGALTLRTLDRVAAAMGCRVVCLLVPGRGGQTFTELEARISGDRRLLEDTEHSMALEAQDVGNVAERAKRGIRRHGKK